MIKKLNFYIITLIFVLSSLNLTSQITNFQSTISSVLDDMVYDVDIDSLGNYFILGNRNIPYSETVDKSTGIIWKMNNNGVVVDSCIIKHNNDACRIYNINYINNELFVSGIAYDTAYPFYNNTILLYKLNNNLDIVDSNFTVIEDSLKVYYVDQTMSFNNEILLTGYMLGPDYNGSRAYISKYSSELYSLKMKIFDRNIWLGVSVKELVDNNYFLIGAKRSLYSSYHYMIFDSSFTLISDTAIPEGTNPYGAYWVSDSSFYLTGNYATGTTNIHDVSLLYQKDIYNIDNYEFNLWGSVDTFDIANNNGIDLRCQDTIYFGSTKNFAFGQGLYANIYSWNAICQTDSNLNIRWERFYGGDAYYFQRGIKATNDGGCIIVSDKYDFENTDELQRDIYILKLNNEGLITATNENQSSLMHEAIVYPNPGTNRFNVRIAAQYAKSTIELYNINGERIIKREIEGKWAEIETTFLKSGTYIYKIYNKQGLFETGKWIKN